MGEVRRGLRGELIPVQCLETRECGAQGVSRRGRGAVGAWLLGDGGLMAASPTAPKLRVRREGCEGAAGARMCKASSRLQD